MFRLALNLVLFQLGWLACVLSAAAQRPWIGALTAVAIVAWHIRTAPHPQAEVKLIALALAVGAIWDSLLVWRGWLDYPAGMLVPFAAPYWIVLMWALFATTLNVSLRSLREHPLWGLALGAMGGPAAYWAGSALGGVDILQPTLAIGALALGWAVFTPALLAAARRFDGFAPPEARAWT